MTTAAAGSDDDDFSADDVSSAVPEPKLPPPAASPVPRLPGATSDGSALAPPSLGSPLIPPLETTAPTDLVASEVSGSSAGRLIGPSREGFSPLRSEPPPPLISTWWLRSAIVVLVVVALTATLLAEYSGESGDIRVDPIVVGVHLITALSIVLWSYAAMHNANKMVPASLYKRRSDPVLATVLWFAAFAAPIAAVVAFGAVDEWSTRTADSGLDPAVGSTNETVEVILLAAIVMVAFVVAWLPFRYHARQAARIGAPRRAMQIWFFAPLLALVGGTTILALGLHDQLAAGGLTPSERTVQLGVVYGLPMIVLALGTWRAITVFDEVIDLRWKRWRVEWEQTIEEFVRQPTPGPEDSPEFNTLDS